MIKHITLEDFLSETGKQEANKNTAFLNSVMVNKEKNLFFSILDEKAKEIVGFACIYDIDTINRHVWIDGIVLDKKYHSELVEAMVALLFKAFGDMDCVRVCTKYLEKDVYRKRLWDHLRFVTEAILRSHLAIDGEPANAVCMGMLKHEFERFYLSEKNVIKTVSTDFCG